MNKKFGFALVSPLLLCASIAHAQCDINVGALMELTGPAGKFGQGGAKAIELALRDLNQAGGVAGCELKAQIRDSQSQGAVGVDMARQLVDIQHVPVIIGGVISSVTLPVLSSVSVPSGVVQISPASSSPTLTEMGREGKTKGLFFRTITSDALQGLATASFAKELKIKKVAILYVNNDYGVNLKKEFSQAYVAEGGEIVSAIPYNERQASYLPEVTQALSKDVDALYLIGYPTDGTTIMRSWISQGGEQTFLLNDGLNNEEFISGVGAKYLNKAYGTSSGSLPSISTAYFEKAFPAFSKMEVSVPGVDRAYDAAAIVGLAIANAGKADSESIRDSMRKVLDANGEVIGAGPEEFKRGLEFIKQGKAIRYSGLIGPVQFDNYGDITGPFSKWKFSDGKVEKLGEISVANIDKLKATVDKAQ